MKNMQRWMAMVLAVVLVLTMMPVYAAAEEEIPAAVTETVPAETEAAEPETGRVSGTVPMKANPRYPGMVAPEEIPAAAEPRAVQSQPEYGTAAQAEAIIREGMEARKSQITVYIQTVNQDFGALYEELFFGAMEHTGVPTEGDYLAFQFRSYGGSYGGEYDAEGNYYMTYVYNVTYYDTAQQQATMDAAVNSLLSQLNLSGKSDYEKICGIYDWMCANITYDNANLNDNSYTLKYTAYAALVNRTAVCQGYANLFYRLALALGVDSRIISGTGITNAGSGPHAWNIVKLEGSYYDADATWDATWKQAGLEYEWFLKNEGDFSADHVRNEAFTTAAFRAAYPMAETDYTPTEEVLTSGKCGENLFWTYEDGILTISGEGEMDDFDSGECLRPWEDYVGNITKVTVEDGVTSIGNRAFAYHWALTDISLPDSLISIGDYAFAWSYRFASITLPEKVTHIGAYAFQMCDGLTQVEIPAGVKVISEEAFSYCTSLASVSLPDGLTEIGSRAFANAYKLENIAIPEGVVTIGGEAFSRCGLKNVAIPASVVSIGDLAFLFCNGVCVDEANAYYASDERGVLFDKNMTTLIAAPNNISGSYAVPETVTKIADSAFFDCVHLTNILLPENLTSIGPYTFFECAALTQIAFGEKLADIGYGAFYGSGLQEVTFPESLVSIGDEAFYGCSSLSRSTFRGSGVVIGDDAFCQCTGMRDIIFCADAPTFGESVFWKVTATAHYPGENTTWTADVRKNYGGSISWLPDTAAGTCGENLTWSYRNGVLTIFGTGDMTDWPQENVPWAAYRNYITRTEIGSGVTNVGARAFKYCRVMESITLPDTLTEICEEAFFECNSLKTVMIPQNVTKIGRAAFEHCISLTQMELPKGITVIPTDAFAECTALQKISLPEGLTEIGVRAFQHCSTLSEIALPESLTEIGNGAFESCYALVSISIPKNVSVIENSAFGSCRSLTEVIFTGKAPTIEKYAFYGVTATVYYPGADTSWTETVRAQYNGTLVWEAYDTAASISGVCYVTLAEALKAAKAGDIILLTADAEADIVKLIPGVTLNLNGHRLEAEYVFVVNGADIVDYHAENKGLLVVDPNRMMISSDNFSLPVWTGEGYIFVSLPNFREMHKTTEDGLPQYIFSPTFEPVAHPYLALGAANSHVRVAIRMTWDIETGSAFQNFVYNDSTVKNVIESFTGSYYKSAFYATITDSQYANFDLQVILISDTGVELVCN